ncbi:MAG: DUF5685 family protein [Eubacteriales bacterium]
MFGYISIDKPELKIKDYIMYRSYYCGLCKSLKEKYGKLGQLTLSYDMTFLVILLSGLYEPDTDYMESRCIAHPFEKHPMRQNEVSDYVAAMNLILTYHKCLDDWIDERKSTKKVFAILLQSSNKKVNEFYQEKAKNVSRLLEEIHVVEKAQDKNIDVASGLFGEVMSELFSYRSDEWENSLRKIGFYLGKYIYLLDAYEDMEKDSKTKNYNVFLLTMEERENVAFNHKIDFKIDENLENFCYNVLHMMMAECAREFEKLPILENVDILRNILYAGVWYRYEMVRQKRAGNLEKHDESI